MTGKDADATPKPNKGERIAKHLARAGVASRRECEAMIMEGRITLNGKKLASPAINVTGKDNILVDGSPLQKAERTRLWLFNKPTGLVTTNKDPEGRKTIFEALPDDLPRVITIGRLDINTEGLLLLTNDGGLARTLELPTTGWLRRYRVRVHGRVEQKMLDDLKDGIAVDGVYYGSIEAVLEREQGTNAWLSVALREGKNREIKNVLGALGLEVSRLIRVSYGPFQLAELNTGAVRELRGKALREQLGPRMIEESGADFDAPISNPFSNAPVEAQPVERVKAARSDRPDAMDKRKKALDQLQTSKPRANDKGNDRGNDRGKDRGNDRGKPDRFSKRDERNDDRNKGGAGDRAQGRGRNDSDVELMPANRGAHIWMAPGARPLPKNKIRDEEKRRRDFGDPKRQNRGDRDDKEPSTYRGKSDARGDGKGPRSETRDHKPSTRTSERPPSRERPKPTRNDPSAGRNGPKRPR